MDTFAAIAARRTIRDFTEQEISAEILDKLFTAGLQAPTNNHMREWEFILLQDREKRHQLLDMVIHPLDEKGALQVIDQWGLKNEDQRNMYLKGIPRQYSMLAQAACLILPCFRQDSPLLHPQTLSDLNPFASIWLCIENILIAAADQGILGVVRIPMEDEIRILKQQLHIPTNYEIPCFLALGYPTENAHRAKQIEINTIDKIHYDKW
ncbi:MAG: nitroreductase family protein [Anaerolineaceae bacterium]|nr:nitroreductase family protein [Anaerolineaceae bacterium]